MLTLYALRTPAYNRVGATSAIQKRPRWLAACKLTLCALKLAGIVRHARCAQVCVCATPHPAPPQRARPSRVSTTRYRAHRPRAWPTKGRSVSTSAHIHSRGEHEQGRSQNAMLTNSHSEMAMARGCEITTNVTCLFAQSDGGPTIQSVPESIWPQHHTLTWSCSMAPQQVNNDSTILGKPELQLLQVRRVQAMRAGGKDQRNPFQPFAQDCSAMQMVCKKRPGYCSGAIHAKFCSHTRERGHRA